MSSDYRIGVCEITNDQWSKFETELAVSVTGAPANAYDDAPYWTSPGVPVNEISWYEAAQFVNWLNISEGYHAAYRFMGTQGTDDYTLDVWDASEADNGTNLYRHRDAFYYLPTEDEWVKAAYWNGVAIQTYATANDATPVAGVYANYGYAPGQPWDVGSGTKELNGTFDMMGNVWEWMESPYSDADYGVGATRALGGGSYCDDGYRLAYSHRNADGIPENAGWLGNYGFRVAADVPEPHTLFLLVLGAVTLFTRRSVRMAD
ncbi:MAG: SUMF1/EgtB/PvdO family nonheme iron enzyme [Phycisphaerae bacterium]|nr:SUMF1/EgtB/PvdO family nonheme iron enzyme [Phycisphaerae bacterium]